ncbi:MAG: nucleotidyl transferase AbiEii/AbiGii toxin family protein, partial [Armatimonadaceae bacterium]
RFLVRLSRSSYRHEFVLKGAALFEIWFGASHRPTRDLDFLAFLPFDHESLRAKLIEIGNLPATDDPLIFDMESLFLDSIRDNEPYGGIRAKFTARLASAKIPVRLDFAVGDSIGNGPVESLYPTLLNTEPARILAYPMEIAFAEKLETIVRLSWANSRMKDYFDLWFLITADQVPNVSLKAAIRSTFSRRRQPLPDSLPPGLSDDYAADPIRDKQWRAFAMRVDLRCPPLPEVVRCIRDAVWPVLFLD